MAFPSLTLEISEFGGHQQQTLLVRCSTGRFSRSTTKNEAAKKKVDLTVGGIPLGVGATLDDIVQLGPSPLDGSAGAVRVTLKGPQVTFAKKKLKIMRAHWLDVQDYLAPPHK